MTKILAKPVLVAVLPLTTQPVLCVRSTQANINPIAIR